MIPRSLYLRNFMCYREVAEPLDFSGLSIACLSGENGAGKSTLLDALTWALWGKARLNSDDELIALGTSEMEVNLVFALDGLDYQVIRKRSKGKRAGTTELYFHVRNGAGWKTISGAGVRDTQELISRTLRMNYETFTNSAFLRQGHADEFTRKKPAERKGVLSEILGLGVYEELEASAKERARDVDGRIRGLDGKIEAYEIEARQQAARAGLVATAEAQVAECIAAVSTAEAAHTTSLERYQQLEALRPLRAERAAQLERLCDEHTRLAGQLAELRSTLADATALAARRADIVAGANALRTAQAELERIEGLRTNYDALAEQRASHSQALHAAEQHLRTELRLAEGELKGLRERAAGRAALVADVAALSQQLAGLPALEREQASLRDRRAALHDQLEGVHKLQLERGELQYKIDSKHDSLIATREEWKRQVKTFASRTSEMSRWQSERERAATERGHLEAEATRLERLRADANQLAEQAGALRAERDSIKQRGEEINKKLALLTSEATSCPLCGSPLGHDGIGHIEAEYERERTLLREGFSAAGREASALERKLANLTAEIAAIDQRVATLPAVAGTLARLDAELRSAEELRQQQADLQRQLSALELQLLKGDYERDTRAELTRVEAALKGLGEPDALNREGRRIDQQLRKVEGDIGSLADARANREARQREIAAIDQEAPKLAAAEAQCASLRQQLENEAFGQAERVALANIAAKLAQLGYTPAAYEAARNQVRSLAHWADEERKLETAEERLARDRHALARDEELFARRAQEIAIATSDLAALEAQLRELPAAQQARDTAATALRNAQQTLNVARRELHEREALLRRSEEDAARLLECRAERETLRQRKGLFDELTVAFGKKGVQAMLIETAIPEIENEANSLLAHMTDNQMHLTFETQGATKRGDPTETLEIKIADALGTRDYDAYSGGEGFRVDFAIRIALAKLLARRAGARLETLVIDEGFGSQDARGRERLVEAITSVQRDFKQILVVTHIQELKDMFPAFIEVTKTPQGSTWAVG